MKKYTFEELSTPGTKIVINKELQYRCQKWKDTEPNYIFTFDNKSNYEIKSTPVSYRGIIYIIFDNIDSQLNHYMVSISEFERVGLLEETFPEKWQLDVKQLDKDKLQIVKEWINKNSQSGCYSYNLDAFKYLIFPLWNNTHICDSIKLDYTEITFEQFQKHILKEIPMNKRTITKEQAQSIVDSACSTWKEKLCAKWATSIVLGLSIDIDEAFYKEMRGACTKEQHELFDKIFGSDKKEIEWDKLKTGSVVMIKYTSQHCNGFYEIDENKPVGIIFYKTKHFINSDKEFKKQGNNSSYITFYQDGRYVLFTSNKNNDCIIDVIEY